MPSKTAPKFSPTAFFQPFDWLGKDCQTTDTDILKLAKDIATGVKLSLQLIEKAAEEAEDRDEALPYLNAYHSSVLNRYAISTCKMLSWVIEHRFDSLNEQDIRKAPK